MRIIHIYSKYAGESVRDSEKEREYTIVWLAHADSRMGSVAILMDPLTPKVNIHTYNNGKGEYDPNAICREVSPKQISDYYWEITCTYRVPEPTGGGTQPETDGWINPINLPPQRRRNTQIITVYPLVDLDGNPITNSARQPFQDDVGIELPTTIYTLTRNELIYDEETMTRYKGSLNSTTFLGYPPRTVKMAAIDGDEHIDWVPQRKIWFAYVTVTYAMHFNYVDPKTELPVPWDAVKLDKGEYYYYDPDLLESQQPFPQEIIEAHKKFPVDGLGNVAIHEVMLNSGGGKLSDTQLTNNEYKYITFKTFREKNWTNLHLE